MNRFYRQFVAISISIIFFSPSWAANPIVLESKYAKIIYFDNDDLREFNDELYMGRLRRKMPQDGIDTMEDEVKAKIDIIVEKVMKVLDMYPEPLIFSMEIHPTEEEVHKVFRRLYRISVDYIAFYSPGQNRIFYSAENANLRVVAHEIGHVVVEHYFQVSPPQRVHEVLAQFAEKHITD